jgi:biotin synthase
MNKFNYKELRDMAFSEKTLDNKLCEDILTSSEIDLLPLLEAAYEVRQKYWGKKVNVHIINNVQNGGCSQDCSYCVQSKNSHAEIETYSMKSEVQIMKEAKTAYESGAFRHCMVFSGPKPSKSRIDKLVEIIKKIKDTYNIQVCVSPGFVDYDDALTLKKAGLNRLNHNLNTSERYYSSICSSHTFKDRINTIKAAKSAGLEICSGCIIGMGEDEKDIINIAKTLHELKIESIPINFFLPIQGLPLKTQQHLTPEYCLRALCLFRFLNPRAEIRIAAGREVHLRSMQAMALFPANSLFMEGYLNSEGSNAIDTLQMIKDAGFTINSDKRIEEIINNHRIELEKEPLLTG